MDLTSFFAHYNISLDHLKGKSCSFPAVNGMIFMSSKSKGKIAAIWQKVYVENHALCIDFYGITNFIFVTYTAK
jgi:hypothetical protein